MAGARGQRRRSRRSERGAAAALRPLRPRSRAASASPRAAGAGPPPRHGERDAAVGRAASADPGELAAAERQPRAARPRPLQQVSGAMRPSHPGPAAPTRAGGMDGLRSSGRNASLRLAGLPARSRPGPSPLPRLAARGEPQVPWGSGWGRAGGLRSALLPCLPRPSPVRTLPAETESERDAAGRFCALLPADPLP